MNERLVWIGGVVGAAMIAAGCGGSDDGVFTTTGAGTTATSAATTGTGGGTAAGTGGSTGGTGGATTGAGGSSSATGAGGAGGAAAATGVGGGGGAGGGCAPTAWFCDADVDGHGDINASVQACVAPPGVDNTCFGPYVDASDDCGPNDDRAYPGETDYYGTPVKPPVYAVLPFDFDCDGAATADPDQLFKGNGVLTCAVQDCFGINPPEGFGPNAQCGSSDQYFKCEQPLGQACGPHEATAPDPLRCR